MCHPEAQAEGSPWGRRPERSEGCLAIARHKGVRDFFETALEFNLIANLKCHIERVSSLSMLTFLASPCLRFLPSAPLTGTWLILKA